MPRSSSSPPSSSPRLRSLSGRTPWRDERGIEPVVERWLASKTVKPCFCADRHIAGEGAAFAPLPPDLAPELAGALRRRGIERLYTHQARAFDAARERPAMVVATPTASGKSLCFHLP